MSNKTFYYARVSTKEQNLDRQISRFKELGADERYIITDKTTGYKIEDRPGYSALRNYFLRSGDTLVITSLDRLSRNKSDIKSELSYFKDNNIKIKILDLPLTMVEYPENQLWVQDAETSPQKRQCS